MKNFNISDIIEKEINGFVNPIKTNVQAQIVVKGINFSEYYVLRGNESNGYNFVSLDNYFQTYFKEPKISIEECIRIIAIEGKQVNHFESFKELCEWYLETKKK